MEKLARLRNKRYAAFCDRCEDFFAFPAKNFKDARAFMERCGWRDTVGRGWMCRYCLQEQDGELETTEVSK